MHVSPGSAAPVCSFMNFHAGRASSPFTMPFVNRKPRGGLGKSFDSANSAIFKRGARGGGWDGMGGARNVTGGWVCQDVTGSGAATAATAVVPPCQSPALGHRIRRSETRGWLWQSEVMCAMRCVKHGGVVEVAGGSRSGGVGGGSAGGCGVVAVVVVGGSGGGVTHRACRRTFPREKPLACILPRSDLSARPRLRSRRPCP